MADHRSGIDWFQGSLAGAELLTIAGARRTCASMTSLRILSTLAALTVACTSGAPASEAPASSSPQAVATSAAVASAPASAPSSVASAAPPVSATSEVGSAAPVASSAAADQLPAVSVKNIGIHIGGGPTDEAGMKRTKGPIKRSVEPHFDAFKRCFAKVSDAKKGGDVSVDLRIEKDGGKAALKKYKSALKGDGFEECVRAAFDAIDFEKPADGATVVSYSLRFTPEK